MVTTDSGKLIKYNWFNLYRNEDVINKNLFDVLNSFEAADGTKVQQQGALKDVQDDEGKPSKGAVSNGGYTYVGDDGQTYSVTYTADETG